MSQRLNSSAKNCRKSTSCAAPETNTQHINSVALSAGRAAKRRVRSDDECSRANKTHAKSREKITPSEEQGQPQLRKHEGAQRGQWYKAKHRAQSIHDENESNSLTPLAWRAGRGRRCAGAGPTRCSQAAAGTLVDHHKTTKTPQANPGQKCMMKQVRRKDPHFCSAISGKRVRPTTMAPQRSSLSAHLATAHRGMRPNEIKG